MKSKTIVYTFLGLALTALLGGAAQAQGFGDFREGHRAEYGVGRGYGGYGPFGFYGRETQGRADAAIDTREAQQRFRIERGLRSGQLTPFEATQLKRQQWDIQQTERRFEADGRLNPLELRVLDGKLDDADRAIFRETHDREFR